MIYDYIIIGSGPAGVSFLEGVFSEKLSILVIDGSGKVENYDFYKPENLNYQKHVSPKLNSNASIIMNKNSHSFIQVSDKNFYFGFNRGGLSRLWGGNLQKFDQSDLKKNNLNSSDNSYESLSEAFKSIKLDNKKKFIIGNSVNNYEKNLLTELNKNNHKNFDFFISQNALLTDSYSFYPFDFSNFLFKYINKKNISFINTHVVKINNNGYKNTVFTNKKKYFAKKIILAAGNIGTTKIIINSFCKNVKKFNILNTPLAVVPFLFLKSLTLKKYKNTNLIRKNIFSKISINFRFLNHSFHGSIHSFDAFLSSYFYNSIFSVNLINRFCDYFSNKIYFALFYFDSSFSKNEVSTSGETNTFYIKSVHKKKFGKFYKAIQKNFFSILIKSWCLPLMKFKILNNGNDNHYGGSLSSIDNIKLSINDNGMLNNFKNIYVVDSSYFKYLPAKHLTFTVMSNAYRIGKFLNKKDGFNN